MSTLANLPLLPRYIIRYAGAAVSFSGGGLELVTDERADRWPTEPEAWYAAYQNNLSAHRCTVVAVPAAAAKAAIH